MLRGLVKEEFLGLLLNYDVTCINQLRMDTHTFRLLCTLCRTEGRLKEDGLVPIEEQIAMFLHILDHHAKNHVVKFKFQCSGETMSRYFNLVLSVVLRLQGSLLVTAKPSTEDCEDKKWQWFKVLWLRFFFESWLYIFIFSIACFFYLFF